MEPLRGMVKVSSPRSLDDAIRATFDLERIVKSLRGGLVSKGSANQKSFAEAPSKAKAVPPSRPDQLDAATRRKLKEEGKCFYYKKAWELGHHCMGKGQVHYIEVFSKGESDDSELELGANVGGSE